MREVDMAIASVFKSGNGQAVQLPKQFRFKGREIKIFRRGDEVVLKEESHPMLRAFELLANLPDDKFSGGRKDDPPQRRKEQNSTFSLVPSKT
jgi:antitoxin VapB